jgi:hypothetical protein
MYLAIYEKGAQLAIQIDLQAEVEVQMAAPLPIGRFSGLFEVDNILGSPDAGPIRVLQIDRWSPELVALLDTHVIGAPNFRNRLTDVLRIVADDPSVGGPS